MRFDDKRIDVPTAETPFRNSKDKIDHSESNENNHIPKDDCPVDLQCREEKAPVYVSRERKPASIEQRHMNCISG
jgi:hypothetical protein